MANKPWTDEEAARLVDAFRDLGPAWTAVSERTGRHVRTVKRAYENGLRPNKRGFSGLEPIKATIAKEQAQARAALVNVEEVEVLDREEALGQMAEQVIAARIRTGHILRELKDAVGSLSPSVKGLADGAGALCYKIGELLGDIEVVVRSPEDDQISVSQAMWMLKDVAFMMATLTQTVRELNDMERRELGEPTEIVGVQMQMSEAEMNQFLVDAKHVFSTLDTTAIEEDV